MKQEPKKTREKIQLSTLLSRLPIAIVALLLGSVLILWDMGIINIPFLTRRERREPTTTQTEEEALTEEQTTIDWNLSAQSALGNLYHASLVENAAGLMTASSYSPSSMSVLKTLLEVRFTAIENGFLTREDGALFRVSDLAEIPNGQNFTPTSYRTEDGKVIFRQKADSAFFVLNPETLAFDPISFDPAQTLPVGQENTQMTLENGLYGYTGTYRDSRSRKQTFTVPAQYPTAFPYAENRAVMADAQGKVTIRNEKGEVIFANLNLILPQKEGVEALGFSQFENGILRVIFATYDENGALTGTREGILDQNGNEVTLPQGFQAVSYREGILVVTNGSKWGYLSAAGAWIHHPTFSHCEPFYEGIGVVTNEHGKKGLVDAKGGILLPCAFDSITNFSEGSALLFSSHTGMYLLTKVSGVFPPDRLPIPTSSSLYTKVTITRGPQNTFNHEDDIVIEFPDISITTQKPHPEFWQTTTTKAPTTTTAAPANPDSPAS